ncbi:EEF1A lysine methyltransferase 4 [Oncorhynchus mykiss]|uniref:EEF1A lysine methyltransferase 4 n=1 Tax=Oncorhynchus mykiss TaxID=8022 RepID=A0A8K9V555_ONCMY|nr:EEF1A lysine methyltransferase 4 [Oncorhynchus mykiss]XP_036842325.1 EEF1A lysine methyltransferase 4 [Oncorhynchus mykiss]
MEYLPDRNSRYKDVDYWDERYKTEKSFEWFGDFSKFQHLLQRHVMKDDAILVLGCGNSSMSSDMYDAGYHSITNIDYSSVCIDTMTARHDATCPGMTWHQMDARQLSFMDASYDVVLEKGTLDAMLVEEKDPWKVSSETACLIDQVLREISRVLKPGGRFLSVTFAQPHFRKRLYARHDYCWSVRTRSYGDGFQYFLYVLTKGEELSPEDVTLERRLLEEAQDSPNEVRTQEEDTESFLYCIDL